jgi:hypothetical protein
MRAGVNRRIDPCPVRILPKVEARFSGALSLGR